MEGEVESPVRGRNRVASYILYIRALLSHRRSADNEKRPYIFSACSSVDWNDVDNDVTHTWKQAVESYSGAEPSRITRAALPISSQA